MSNKLFLISDEKNQYIKDIKATKICAPHDQLTHLSTHARMTVELCQRSKVRWPGLQRVHHDVRICGTVHARIILQLQASFVSK